MRLLENGWADVPRYASGAVIGHLVIALSVQLLLVAATRSWWGGAMAAAGWAI